jgi:hypothetical protein
LFWYPKQSHWNQSLAEHPFAVMCSSCITTSFNEFFFSQREFSRHKQEKEQLEIQRTVPMLSLIAFMSPRATFPFSILKLKILYSNAFSSFILMAWLFHCLKIHISWRYNCLICFEYFHYILLQAWFKGSFTPDLKGLPCQFHFPLGLLSG